MSSSQLRRFPKRDKPVSTRRQLLQQRLHFLQIDGIESLGEPTVDVREHLSCFGYFPLLLPEVRELLDRPELKQFGTLTAGNCNGFMDTFCFGKVFTISQPFVSWLAASLFADR